MTFPKRPPYFPALLIVGGAGLLLWLSAEDRGSASAVLAGFGVSLMLALDWLLRRVGGRRVEARILWIGGLLFGAVIGAGAALAAALLMLLKNGVHGHLFPDYPFETILATLMRAPVWGAAGVLIVGGLLLSWRAFRR